MQVEGDQRVHDEPFDRNNLQRESVGIAGKVGAAVNMFGSLTGEMASAMSIASTKIRLCPMSPA